MQLELLVRVQGEPASIADRLKVATKSQLIPKTSEFECSPDFFECYHHHDHQLKYREWEVIWSRFRETSRGVQAWSRDGMGESLHELFNDGRSHRAPSTGFEGGRTSRHVFGRPLLFLHATGFNFCTS